MVSYHTELESLATLSDWHFISDNCPLVTEEPPTLASQDPSHLSIIYGISSLFMTVVVTFVACLVVLIVKLKRSKPDIYNTIKREIQQGSARLQNTLRRMNETEQYGTQGFENRSVC